MAKALFGELVDVWSDDQHVYLSLMRDPENMMRVHFTPTGARALGRQLDREAAGVDGRPCSILREITSLRTELDQISLRLSYVASELIDDDRQLVISWTKEAA